MFFLLQLPYGQVLILVCCLWAPRVGLGSVVGRARVSFLLFIWWWFELYLIIFTFVSPGLPAKWVSPQLSGHVQLWLVSFSQTELTDQVTWTKRQQEQKKGKCSFWWIEQTAQTTYSNMCVGEMRAFSGNKSYWKVRWPRPMWFLTWMLLRVAPWKLHKASL